MDLKLLRNSTIAATRFLLSQQNPDGSFNPVDLGLATHAKLLVALNDMGQQPKAAQLCGWLSEYALDEEGDFTGLSRPQPWDRFYCLGNAWLALGAMRLGQFSVAYPAVSFLTSLQHADTGGFFTAGPAATVNGEQDLLTTALCGLACLQCGQLEPAEAAGRFVIGLWDRQPGGAAAHLFLSLHNGDKINTAFPPEQALYYMVDATRTEQWYQAPAYAAGFLAALRDATADSAYLEGAGRYLQFLESCAADRYSSVRSAWLGWASALAFEMTGNANFQRTAEQVAQALLAQQLNNGSWLQGSMCADLESDVMDGTAEGIVALNQMLRSLVGGAE